jgi:hypothetical protein
MAQTAVEWFVQQLEEYGSDDFKIIFKKQFEQAKAMEKEQIIDAFNSGLEYDYDDSETYYNKTFNK